MKRTSKGFAVFELVLVLAILAGIGLVGYKVYGRGANSKASITGTSEVKKLPGVSTQAVTVPTIDNKADLDQANSSLDEADKSSDTNNSHDDAVLNSEESQLDN